MKKLIVALVLSFALIGCSGGGGDATSTPADTTTVSTPAPDAGDATPAEGADATPAEGEATSEATPAEG
ncbi:MAG: hypothetical protein WC314_14560 [Vulcanimicrobiota bacterium]